MALTPKSPKSRNSAIELLRIFAMLCIVASHSSYHGGFPEDLSWFTPNNYFLDWMLLGNLGVDLYLIITGYFLSTKAFQPVSVCRHLTQVWFYSLLGYGIYLLWGNAFSPADLWTVLFPTLHKSYWFFTAYFVLLCISPCLNIFVEHASRKQFFSLIATMFLLWSVVLTVTQQNMYGETMCQFVMFYLIGAYFRKYPDNLLNMPSRRYLLAFGSLALLFISIAGYRLLHGYVSRLDVVLRFQSPMSVMTVGSAVGLFAVAVYCKPFCSKFINLVGSCTFGVYLLHDNPFVRNILWMDWVRNYEWFHSGYLLPRMAVSIILIFTVCCLVEWLRQKTVARPAEKCAQSLFLGAAALIRKILPDGIFSRL